MSAGPVSGLGTGAAPPSLPAGALLPGQDLLEGAGVTIPARVALARVPTRLERLSRLSRELGLELWTKRDDETGTELSGNKVRKLEFLLAEALAQGADVVLTCGGVQSNHCRATALAARRLGLGSVLFLRGTEPPHVTGNLLLDRMAGAEVHFITPDQYAQRGSLLAEAAQELRAAGRRPYIIPEGGSNALGSWGYVACLAEIVSQSAPIRSAAQQSAPIRFAAQQSAPIQPPSPEPPPMPPAPWDFLVCATGSGGTLAGLALGRRLLRGLVPALERSQILGVPVCDDGNYFRSRVVEIAAEFARRFPPERGPAQALVTGDEIGMLDGYKGPAYAVPYAEEIALIREMAREDGLLLDPVYTGKAFYGLVAEARRGRFPAGSRVLFLHTGGIWSLFAYAEDLWA